MDKPHKSLLLPAICIILFAAVFNFSYWSFAGNEGFREPVNSAHQYDSSKRIFDDYDSKAYLEKREIAVKRRVNVLLLGIEGDARADTIMFISYDSAKSKLSIISIPRDTYFYETGYNNGDQRKINAVYGRAKEEGCVNAVSELLLNTTIDYYINIDYEGVEKIIDAIGGVKVEVPIDMEVGGIKISKGERILNGVEALQYLRFRKKYPNGDIGRIEAQQKLVNSLLYKMQYADLSELITKSFNLIKTNMPAKYMLEYASQIKRTYFKEVSMHILPGVPMYKYVGGYNWSYFFHNPQKVKELMNKISGIESIELKKRKRCEE